MGSTSDNDSRRTLGIRDKQILYRNAKGKCQNPACGRKIEFDEMQVGHKTAWSKGGRTTLKNLVCLCYRCNKLGVMVKIWWWTGLFNLASMKL